MKPGEIITKQNSDINLNDERQSITLKVSNSGDRPIQIGSHYHFAETNAVSYTHLTLPTICSV